MPDQQVIRRVKRHVHAALPLAADQILVGRYNGLRKLSGRNPGRGRVLPDFVIPGAAKAGTTSLWGWLNQHPFISLAPRKEIHYFSHNYYRGDDWYRSHFPLSAERDAFTAEHGRPFLTGEASPCYLSHDWAPSRLAKRLPSAKLLITLRNPVDRALSQFHMSRRYGVEPFEAFGDAVDAEETRLAGEIARAAVDRRYKSARIGDWSYKLRSRYAEQLERWFAVFPREQFHIVTLEELMADPQAELDEVHEFLGVPPYTYGDLGALNVKSYDAMEPEVRASLTEYFRPHNERLYALLGRDLGWDREPARVPE